MVKSIPFGARSTADKVLAGIDLTGKRVLVTGCNSGIGFETMNALLSYLTDNCCGGAPETCAPSRRCEPAKAKNRKAESRKKETAS